MIPRLSQPPDDPAFGQNPYPFYAKAHAAGGVFWWEEYGWPALARFSDVSMALRDRRFGRENPHPPPRPPHLEAFYAFEASSMLEREPPAHTRLRKLVNRAFVSRQVERLRPRIAALAHELIDRLAPGDDLIAGFCEPIPVVVIAEFLGVPPSDAPQLLRWSHDMVAMYQYGRTPAEEAAAERATAEFSAYIAALVEARRRAPAEDLLSALIAAETEAGRLSRDETVATAILLLNAGHEATVHALGNGVKALLESGARPPADPAQMADMVEEILRFDPPLHIFTRYAMEDVEAFGLSLKRGDTIGLILGAAAHDPGRTPDPDVFDPDRPPGGHLSFGAGAHFCVGAPLARLELAAALPVLFDRLPRLRLAETPRYADRYHFHGLETLRVTW